MNATEEWDGENDVTPAGKWNRQLVNLGIAHRKEGQGLDESDILVTAYHGAADGKPVIQIDTSPDVDLRVNVNDAPVFNQSVDSNEFGTIKAAAQKWLDELLNYIIDDAVKRGDDESAAAYQAEADTIEAALKGLI